LSRGWEGIGGDLYVKATNKIRQDKRKRDYREIVRWYEISADRSSTY
jgi:hypothetical protein